MEDKQVADNQVAKKIPDSDIAKDQPVSQDDKQTENLIPQSRFNEINSQNKKLQEQIDNLNTQNVDRKKLEMEKNGQYKELIAQQKEEIGSLTEIKVKRDAERQARREKLIQQLPEDKREKYAKHPLDFLEDAVEVFSPKASGKRVDTTAPLSNLGVTDKSDIFGANSKISDKDKKKNWSSIVQAFKNKN